jgi:hypothetical protein
VAWSLTLRETKVNGSDPPLPAVLASYPAKPFPALFDPPIEPARMRPRGHLDLERWIDFPAICFAKLTGIEVPHI